MAFIITTPIGTDRGLVSNAYVRINEYRVMKTGECVFDVHIYKSKDEAILADSNVATYGRANHLTSFHLDLKEFKVFLQKEITINVTVPLEKPVSVTVQRQIGDRTYTQTETQTITEMSTYDTTIKVADWEQLHNHTIFEFGYAKLYDKLCDLFGAENIIDDHSIALQTSPTWSEAYNSAFTSGSNG
jgi:hypothetical protein